MSDLAPATNVHANDGELRGRGDRLLAVVAVVPALVAFAVGFLYLVGAILWAARFTGSDIDGGEVLPLIPLPQIVGRGIETGLFAGLVALFAGGIAGLVLIRDRERLAARRALTKDARPQDEEFAFKPWQLFLIALLVVFLALAIWPAWGIAFLALILAAVWIVRSARQSGDPNHPRFARMVALVAFLCVTGAVIGNAFWFPARLPEATVRVEKGGIERGAFVTVADGNWLLWTDRARLRAIPNRRVIAGEVRPLAAPKERSALGYFIGSKGCDRRPLRSLCYPGSRN